MSPQCFDLAASRVLVSTVGIPDAMVRCAQRFPRLRMALSLHSARQEQRERIIPLARRYPLDRLRSAMAAVTAIQRQPIMVEYLLLDDVNDTDEDVEALIGYLHELSVHINLIPYNAIQEAAGLRNIRGTTASICRGAPGGGVRRPHSLFPGGRHRRRLRPARPTRNRLGINLARAKPCHRRG